MWFWILFPAYIMIETMKQVAPEISRWNTGVLSFICFMAWTQFVGMEVDRYRKKQLRKQRRDILREKINKL